MIRKYIVYRHTSPSGKVYIGITSKSARKRWQNGAGYMPCKAFYKAILKYGWDNIKHEILFTNLNKDRAEQLEIMLIKHYKNLSISYNITDGGKGFLGYKPNEATRKLLSEASKKRKNYTWSEESRELLRQAHKRNISSYKSTEFREKISQIVDYKKVKVLQFTLSGGLLRSFNSANEAQKHTGVDRGAILRCCKGKVKRAGNFIWKYYE